MEPLKRIKKYERKKVINPVVSIVCTTYNHDMYIREAIEGFLMQETSFPFEIIIHDDASTDSTPEIIKEFERLDSHGKIKAIFQKENQHSKGVEIWSELVFPKARGKYIALCEGDDYWTDLLKLQKQVEYMESNPDVVLTYHKHKNVDKDGNFIDYRDKPLTCTLMFVNDFDSMPVDIDCPNGDRLLLTYFSLKGSLKFLEDIEPSVRRHHEGGVMSMASEKEKLIRQVQTWSSIYEAFKDTRLSGKLYAKKHMFIYRQMLNNWKEGKESLLSIIIYPAKIKSLFLYKLFVRKMLNSKK